MGIFSKKKPDNDGTSSSVGPGARGPAKISAAKPKRSKSNDDIDMSGFTGIKKPSSGSSFEKKPIKKTRSGISLKSKDSVKGGKGTSAKPSLEMLMNMQAETNKVVATKKPCSNSSLHSSDLSDNRSRGVKKPLKDRGRSKSPNPRARTPSRARSKSVGRRGLKPSKSDNLSNMVDRQRKTASATDDPTNGRGMSKLAQMKNSSGGGSSAELVALKKENQELLSKKRNLKRQLEDEQKRNESLEKEIMTLQRQLERGSKHNDTASSRTGLFGGGSKNDDPIKEWKEKVETLEKENKELQAKLKKDRRDHEQIVAQKDAELKELDESLEQFMAKNGGAGVGNNDRKLQNEMAQLKAQLRVAEGQITKLRGEVEEKDLELRTLRVNKRGSLETITKADSDAVHIMKENEELQDKLKFKDETIEHLMDQLKTLKLSGSTGMKKRMSGKLKPEAPEEESGLTGLWNKLSPGTLRNRKQMDRATRKEMAATPAL